MNPYSLSAIHSRNWHLRSPALLRRQRPYLITSPQPQSKFTILSGPIPPSEQQAGTGKALVLLPTSPPLPLTLPRNNSKAPCSPPVDVTDQEDYAGFLATGERWEDYRCRMISQEDGQDVKQSWLSGYKGGSSVEEGLASAARGLASYLYPGKTLSALHKTQPFQRNSQEVDARRWPSVFDRQQMIAHSTPWRWLEDFDMLKAGAAADCSHDEPQAYVEADQVTEAMLETVRSLSMRKCKRSATAVDAKLAIQQINNLAQADDEKISESRGDR
ncbi:uncharacterized protein MYCGRDRAFT_97801 [Zymoseptoria tritici IPO323]|uniref:Uncharacterized protein n=1 Tax=Zymoseptoria tritici (strain CBS 115943 / IPO323) TaxID=336722 RepID=F9XRE9_ZYMTI|nr:uncharacterized protein MYCGRDRAFT_97801 [Zymoseptoria tritici IPO323]EGP82125.1 hypothetical protein MYCGRDRAFT_97801 [Zymoseptoria tritici IPO323]